MPDMPEPTPRVIPVPRVEEDLSAGDLLASSKRKFGFAQARLRRQHNELVLLSLAGSLHDAQRAHLRLHRRETGSAGDVLALLDQIPHDPDVPLTPDEVEHIRRIAGLQQRIAQGEAVTIAPESIAAHLDFVGALLPRYGAIVVVPEPLPPASPVLALLPGDSGSALAAHLDDLRERAGGWLLPALLVAGVLLVLLSTAFLVQQSRLVSLHSQQQTTATPPDAARLFTTPDAARNTEPTRVPPDALAPGRTAYVRDDVADGLALRAAPGTDPAIPIQIYLAPGTAVEVVSGPRDADGYSWWEVRAANRAGWCAGEFLVVR